MNLHELLQEIETANHGSSDLDEDFGKVFGQIQANVTTCLDAVISLIRRELPCWWWSCGYFKITDEASGSISGSGEALAGIRAVVGVDGRAGPEAMRLLNDHKMGAEFDEGFHCIRRGGTIQLALLAVLLKGKIALAQFEADASNN